MSLAGQRQGFSAARRILDDSVHLIWCFYAPASHTTSYVSMDRDAQMSLSSIAQAAQKLMHALNSGHTNPGY
ncbi:hypothetical protein PM082_009100 [Marasmius tenuissimus]|nr:hypothetical protein PM082_009100 [Marasmius tenuissimus]